jgi:arylsulfatase
MLIRILFIFCLCPTLFAAQKPNILLIMSDDMGFSDIGCYGSEIKTPSLDKLAGGGVRFTQFYNNARCCPTRASLLTGLYPHETGIGHMMEDRGRPGYRGDLNNECVTIAEALQPAGYRTYMCGKWHVTRAANQKGSKANWPVNRGFEKFYGTIAGGGSFYDPTTLCRQDTFITPENDPEYKPKVFYYTDALSDNAVMFLDQHSRQAKDTPFFMYISYTAAHWPMHALPEDIKKYEGNYNNGYDPIRKERAARQRAMGLTDRDWKLSPADEDWNTVGNKEWEARCMEVYAAMVDRMDQGIGRVVEQLRKMGQLNNTLIFFLQDNGGCAEQMGRTVPADQPTAPPQPFGPNDLQPKVWPPMQTRDGRWVRRGPGVMPGPEDTYVAYGRGWANVSNTPFREYKHWVHEGGISTPLILHWPDAIDAKSRGKLYSSPGHIIDIMATCVDVAGASYPRSYEGNRIKPMKGISLKPALTGKPLRRDTPIFWEHEGNKAIRQGQWKLVAKADQPWELYDLDEDRTEMMNLAAKHPDIVKQLEAKWQAWADKSDVLPFGAWAAQPKAPGKAKKNGKAPKTSS